MAETISERTESKRLLYYLLRVVLKKKLCTK